MSIHLFKFLNFGKKRFADRMELSGISRSFFVNKEGNVIERFAPQTSPLKIKKKIKEIIQ